MIGTPIPYHIGNDNLFLSLYLINILVVAFMFLANGEAIAERIKGMFYYGKQGFDKRHRISGLSNILLYTQNILFFTIITLDFLLYNRESSLCHASYIYIITFGIIFLLFLIVKRIVYDIVNIVLFTSKQAKEWRESYFFTIQLTGFMLFPLVTAIIFIPETPPLVFQCYAALVLFIYLYMLFVRCFNIIFTQKRDVFNIFLYLCAIELLPLAVLGKAILAMNSILTIKF